ncbi:MAG: hypothetical protein ACRC28_16770, partial [Clostridium sp.]|uniref:hypothetical protein n=1 Tax=Clostridium sp. TaxID=1506 RepID=UPI003F3367DB
MNNDRIIKINKISLYTMIIMIFYFKPYYVTYNDIEILNNIYIYGLRVIFIGSMIMYIKNKNISKFVVAISFYYFVRLFTTIINKGDIGNVVSEIYVLYGFIFSSELLIKRNLRGFLLGFKNILGTLFLINLIEILKSPYGYGTIYEKIYFQRPGNQLISFCIICIVITVIYSRKYKNKKCDISGLLTIIGSIYMSINIRSSS